MPKKKEETAVTTSGYGQLAEIDIAAMMSEELDGLDLSFERVKIPSGGALMFELPGEDGDEGEMVKEFSGVIIHHHALHSYYASKYTGGNAPPDCSSFDGKTGMGTPGGVCEKCSKNAFGSGDNGSKACKNRRRVYILREGEMFPLLLSLPTGSLKDFTRYIKRLLSKGKMTHQVVTRFSLKKATNTTGIQYSQAQFTVDRNLAPEEHKHILTWSETIKGVSSSVALEYDTADDAAAELNVDHETGELIEPLTAQNADNYEPPPPPSDDDYPFK
jgi:hypothetical protein